MAPSARHALAFALALTFGTPPAVARGTQDQLDVRLTVGPMLGHDDHVTVNAGERFRLYVEASHPAHIALFDLMPNGMLTLLSPRHPYEQASFVNPAGQYVPVAGFTGGWWMARGSGYGYLIVVASREPFGVGERLDLLGFPPRWMGPHRFVMQPWSVNPFRTIADLERVMGGPGVVVEVLTYYVDLPFPRPRIRFVSLCAYGNGLSTYPIYYVDGRFTRCIVETPGDAVTERPRRPKDDPQRDSATIERPPLPEFPREDTGGEIERRGDRSWIAWDGFVPLSVASEIDVPEPVATTSIPTDRRPLLTVGERLREVRKQRPHSPWGDGRALRQRRGRSVGFPSGEDPYARSVRRPRPTSPTSKFSRLTSTGSRALRSRGRSSGRSGRPTGESQKPR